jgi:hypothetical protein
MGIMSPYQQLLIMIFNSKNTNTLDQLVNTCSQYVIESCGNPLLKNLSNSYNIIDKVKIRQRKGMDETMSEAYSTAFEFKSLYNRALFTNGLKSIQPPTSNDIITYYVFPVNGYEYLYNPEVMNSSLEYKTIFDLLFHENHTGDSVSVITDLLKFQYKHTDLAEGIQSGTEIIFYSIPQFYVVTVNSFPDYTELYDILLERLDI